MPHEEFEKAVMNKLLEGTDELFSMLTKQYSVSTVVSREFTGCGFFTSFSIPDELIVCNVNGRIDDVLAKFEDSSEVYYFILYIEGGKIDTLEGFSILGEWKCDYEKVLIDYCFKDRRDFNVN